MGRVMKGEFTTAIGTLRRNKGRSMLTMLGIVIAVASVVTVVGITQGATDQVLAQTARLGKDVITILPGQIASNGVFGGSGAFGQSVSGTLTAADVKVIGQTPGVKTVLPLSMVAGGLATGQAGRHYDVPVIGTTPDFPGLMGQSIAYGTFFDNSGDAVNKVILGADAAATMFDQNVPLGQTVTILGQQFIVAGILSKSQVVPFAANADFNSAVFIANNEAQTLTNGTARVYEILARTVSPAQTAAVAGRLNDRLAAAHGGQRDFTVLKQGQTINVTNSILQLLTLLTVVIAVISLFVGGVGIMNVMLVSVTERMHEIGIRKALGATNRQILRQFVIEAAVLSVAGALVGVLVAATIELVIGIFTNLVPAADWQAAIVACLVSVIVGVLFGTIPALKAARKDPISALRNE